MRSRTCLPGPRSFLRFHEVADLEPLNAEPTCASRTRPWTISECRYRLQTQDRGERNQQLTIYRQRWAGHTLTIAVGRTPLWLVLGGGYQNLHLSKWKENLDTPTSLCPCLRSWHRLGPTANAPELRWAHTAQFRGDREPFEIRQPLQHPGVRQGMPRRGHRLALRKRTQRSPVRRGSRPKQLGSTRCVPMAQRDLSANGWQIIELNHRVIRKTPP